MKRIKLLEQMILEQFKTATTPEKKMEYLEDARSLAPSFIDGPWLITANLVISLIEKTIKK